MFLALSPTEKTYLDKVRRSYKCAEISHTTKREGEWGLPGSALSDRYKYKGLKERECKQTTESIDLRDRGVGIGVS